MPTKPSLWSRLQPLERLSFIAQTLATLSLLPTVYFAWATFREAHLARKDQAEYFYGEKAPRLVVTSIELDDGRVIAHIQNNGDSPAISIDASFTLLGMGDECGFRRWSQNSEYSTSERVEKEGQTALWIEPGSEKAAHCEWTRGRRSLVAKPAMFNRSKEAPYFTVTLLWRALNNQEYVARFEAPFK